MVDQHTCLTCLNCSSKLHPLFCCDELDVSLDVDEFEAIIVTEIAMKTRKSNKTSRKREEEEINSLIT